ncbi:M3 family metallopeptidase [Roseateles sp.]|uniref:M3 family metallopeptidase n=1 Tax=Roseateles sp. TaxID=1971397 RepID=UPI00286C5D13|nr:M3 family metallopeptidase [Roseateles sp.]
MIGIKVDLLTLRLTEFPVFDQRLHARVGSEATVQALLDKVRAEVAVTPSPAFNRSQHSYLQLFAGAYSVGLCSQKWADLLSVNSRSAFEIQSVPDASVGPRYLQKVREVGGSRPAIEGFNALRGRDPNSDALLLHQGMR